MFALQSLARIGYAPRGAARFCPCCSHAIPTSPRRPSRPWASSARGRRCPPLLRLVDGELWLQLAAINALGAIGAPEAVGPLMALVPDSVLAEPAVQALRSIAAPESLEPLLGLLPVVHERALRDPLLLAIAVVIDLHPDPAPSWSPPRPPLAASAEHDDVSGPDARGPAPTRTATRRDSLHRAAATLAAAAGLEALEPGSLARLATDPDAAWLEGLFRRFPDGLAARRGPALAHPDPDVRCGALRAAQFEEDELPALFDHLEDAYAPVRAAACYAMGRLELDTTAPLLVERLRRGEPAEQAAAVRGAGPALGGGVGRSGALPRSPRPASGRSTRARRPGRPAGGCVRGRRTAAWRRTAGRRCARPASGPPRACPARAPTYCCFARSPTATSPTQVEALELLVARGGEQIAWRCWSPCWGPPIRCGST